MSKAASGEVSVRPDSIRALLSPLGLVHVFGSDDTSAPQLYELTVGNDTLTLTIPSSDLRRRVVEDGVSMTVFEGVSALPEGYDRELVQESQIEVLLVNADGNLPVNEALRSQAGQYITNYFGNGPSGSNHIPHGFEHEATYIGSPPVSLKEGLIEMSVKQLELSGAAPVAEGWKEVKNFLRETFFAKGRFDMEFLVNFASVPPDQFDWEQARILSPEDNPIYGPYVKAITQNFFKLIEEYKDYRPQVTQTLWDEIAQMIMKDDDADVDALLRSHGDMRVWVMNAKHDSIPLLRDETGLVSEKFAMNLANLVTIFRTTLNAGCYSGAMFGDHYTGWISDYREVLRMLMPTSMPSNSLYDLRETSERGRLLREQMIAHVLSGAIHTLDRGAGESVVAGKSGSKITLPSMHGDFRVRATMAVSAIAGNGHSVMDCLKQYKVKGDAVYLQKITDPARFEYTSAPSTPDFAYKAQGSAACLEILATATALAIEDGYSDVFSWLKKQGVDSFAVFSTVDGSLPQTGYTDINWQKAQHALKGDFGRPELQSEFRMMKSLINIVATNMAVKDFDKFNARAYLAHSYVESLYTYRPDYYNRFDNANGIFSDYYNYRKGNWGEMLKALFRVYGVGKEGTGARKALMEVLKTYYNVQDFPDDNSLGELVLLLNDRFIRNEVHRN